MTPDQLRNRVRALEAEAERAGAAVAIAEAEAAEVETTHRAAVREAVETDDHAPADRTRAALDAARRAHVRAVEMRDQAREMLVQAVRDQRDAARAAARAEIETALAAWAEDARALDVDFARLVEGLTRLRVEEIRLHRLARDRFGRAPVSIPRAITAARGLASCLTTLAGSNTSKLRPWIEEAAVSASISIRKACDGAA